MLKSFKTKEKGIIMNYESIIRQIKAKKDIEISDSNIKKKLIYLQERLGLSEEQTRKVALRNPVGLTLSIADDDENSIESKLETYAELLQLSKSQVIEMYIKFPSMINYDVKSDLSNSNKSIRVKLDFFKEFFGFNSAELGELLYICPQLLGVDIITDLPTSFKTKVSKLEKLFDLDKKGVAKFIRDFTSIIKYDFDETNPMGLYMKVASLNYLGVTNKQIVENPYLLGIPVFDLKFRYMILSSVFTNEEIFRNTYLVISNEKLYARFMFLNKFDTRIIRHGLRADEKRFQKYYKVSSGRLMKEYPLDKKALAEIEMMYNETHKDKPLHFNSLEKNSMLEMAAPIEQTLCQV